MKRYLVKVEMTAKENNKNFKGVWHEYLFGKKEVMLAHRNNEIRPCIMPFDLVSVWGEEDGYKTLSGALKGVNTHSRSEKYWDKKITVVTVEI